MSTPSGFFESDLPLKMAMSLLAVGIKRKTSETDTKALFFTVASEGYRRCMNNPAEHNLTVVQVDATYKLICEALVHEELSYLQIKAGGWVAELFFQMLTATLFNQATEDGVRHDTKAYLGRMVERNRKDDNYWSNPHLQLLFLL